ncbi:MAG: serine hydrolase [Firmicutes bacterium]|nr:serine hydrolase [Bacillota bacterium]
MRWSPVHPRSRLFVLLLAAATGVLLSAQALAAVTPQQALERLMTEEIQPAWFAPAFLSQVPVAQVEAIVAQLTSLLGEYEGIVQENGQFLIVFSEGAVPAEIALDGQGRIQGLFFHPPRPQMSGLEDAVAQLAQLPGTTHLLVISDDGILAAHQPERRLAVGSAFKLAVLAALRDQINAGERSWDEVVLLPAEAKSLPSGILQNWPPGSPVTVHTLAALMISVSDNTATDALIALVGRDRVQQYAAHQVPFLTTREAFVLKDPANAKLLERYRKADAAGREALLEELAALPLPSVEIFAQGTPLATDVEWFFNTYELCSLMARVQDLPLMGINPGAADPGDWRQVAYKGGSEPGVLSMVTGLVGHDGKRYCVAASWNHDAALDELQFYSIYRGILDVLAQFSAGR